MGTSVLHPHFVVMKSSFCFYNIFSTKVITTNLCPSFKFFFFGLPQQYSEHEFLSISSSKIHIFKIVGNLCKQFQSACETRLLFEYYMVMHEKKKITTTFDDRKH